MSNDQLMVKLTNAVSYKYRDDKTSPSVVVSALKKGYYASVVRYGGAFAKDKKVICKASGPDLATTLKDLATKFVALNPQPKDPVQELGDLVSTSK
jgi:hypothetical protein